MRKSMTLLLASAVILLSFMGCDDAVQSSAYEDTPEKIQAWQLDAPSGLEATAGAGYVYLSWKAVDNAEQYAIFRSGENTATQFLAMVDAFDAAVYPSRAFTPGDQAIADGTDPVGGGCTYLDYVNLNNPLEDGTYKYYVMALHDLASEVIPAINGASRAVTDLVRYANSELSAAVTVTLQNVPAKGSILPATQNITLEFFRLDPTYDTYNLSWDINPLASYYKVFLLDDAQTDAYELYDDTDDMYEKLQYVVDNGEILELDTEVAGNVEAELTDFAFNFYNDGVDETILANVTGDYIFTNNFASAVVIGYPYDDYFLPVSYSNSSNRIDTVTIPATITATNDHLDEIIVSWDMVDDADDYQLFRRGEEDSTWTQLTTTMADFTAHIGPIGQPQYYYVDADTSLIAGDGADYLYYYKVRSLIGTEVSRFSNYTQGSIASTDSTITLPATPTGVAATDGEFMDKIELTWTGSDDADQYIIFRSVDGADDYENLTNGPQTFTILEGTENRFLYVDTDVTAGTEGAALLYSYYVIAVNNDFLGDSTNEVLYSAESVADTGYLQPFTDTVDLTTTLAAPTILAENVGGANEISISWNAVDANTATGALAAEGYEVYIKENTVDSVGTTTEYRLIATVVGNDDDTPTNNTITAATGYTATTSMGAGTNPIQITLGNQSGWIVSGSSYDFAVKAYNTSGAEDYYSVLSNEVTNYLQDLATPAIAVTGTAGAVGSGIVDINLRITNEVNGADDTEWILIVSDDNDLTLGSANAIELAMTTANLADALSTDGFDYQATGLATTPTDYWVGVYALDLDLDDDTATTLENDGTGQESYSTAPTTGQISTQ